MSQGELEELVRRLNDVLRKPKILEKLDDGGRRVREKISAAESELQRRAAIEEASVQLEQMSIQSSSDLQTDSSRHSHDNELPKFRAKLELYENRRNAKDSFKPFRTLKRPPETRLPAGATDPSPGQQPDHPVKGFSTLSINVSTRHRSPIHENMFRIFLAKLRSKTSVWYRRFSCFQARNRLEYLYT